MAGAGTVSVLCSDPLSAAQLLAPSIQKDMTISVLQSHFLLLALLSRMSNHVLQHGKCHLYQDHNGPAPAGAEQQVTGEA